MLRLDSMVIAQVSLRLATIKDHSNMCSFSTQHNATDVASFEGACNWHADCRNVHQSCCRKLNVHFSTISCIQRRRRFPVNGRHQDELRAPASISHDFSWMAEPRLAATSMPPVKTNEKIQLSKRQNKCCLLLFGPVFCHITLEQGSVEPGNEET